MKKLFFLLNICVLSAGLHGAPQALILELEDVVLEPYKLRALQKLGGAMLWFAAKNPSLDPNVIVYRKFFEALEKVRIGGLLQNNEGDAHWGHLVPPVLATWQKGALPCSQLLRETKKSIGKHYKGVLHYNERTVFTRIADMALSPTGYCDTHKLVDGVERFLRQHHNYRLFLTANCHQETLDMLRRQYPYLFNEFEGVFISGQIRITKPGPAFYQQLLEQYGLNPAECLCVEAKERNVQTAKEQGMQAMKFQGFEHLARYLREQG